MSDQKHACFVFNPSANGGRAGRKEKALQSIIARYWPAAEWLYTQPGDLFWKELENSMCDVDLLVACGGDGTVHRAGTLAAKSGCKLGIIPIGSGNDFAKMNNIPQSVTSAADLLQKDNVKKIDLIHCSGDVNCWCLNTLGLGLDGLANQYTNYYKRYIGKSSYLPGALQAALASKPMKMSLRIDDKEEISASLLMLTACNGYREGGRFIVAPDAIIDDGKMNLLKVLPMNKLSLLLILPRFINRFPEHLKGIETSTCRTLELTSSDPISLHVDGEYTGRKVRHLKLEIKKRALRLLV